MGVSAANVRALSCPACGGAVELRMPGLAQVAVCGSCGSVLDARHPSLEVIQRFQAALDRICPRIPLGSRGQWRDARYEVVGYQERRIAVDGLAYVWGEYVLFNPYRGFRYLTEYAGHWNDVVTLRAVPDTGGARVFGMGTSRPSAASGGVHYRHFQHAEAETIAVLGELPWQARVGDKVIVDDYVAPPRVLSSEGTGDERTWSVGEYVDGSTVWKAFKLPKNPPYLSGIYANQPYPGAGRSRALWKLWVPFAALVLLLGLARCTTASRTPVYRGTFVHDVGTAGKGDAFVTPIFTLGGRASTVEVRTESNVSNSWLFLDYALINDATGQAWSFGREMSFYSGVDGDGRWTEGSPRDRAVVGKVPSGRYYLRVEPEAQGGSIVRYSIAVRRDVPAAPWLYLLALIALAIPPVFATVRAASFEHQRWQESDYATTTSTDGDDDE